MTVVEMRIDRMGDECDGKVRKRLGEAEVELAKWYDDMVKKLELNRMS